jgi:hypothetical protein
MMGASAKALPEMLREEAIRWNSYAPMTPNIPLSPACHIPYILQNMKEECFIALSRGSNFIVDVFNAKIRPILVHHLALTVDTLCCLLAKTLSICF